MIVIFVMLKQVIAIRKDLKLGKGKIAAQASHASLKAYKKATASVRKEWEDGGEKKVVVAVSSRKELVDIYNKARGLPRAMVKDAGLTQTRPGTLTAVAIGPCDSSEIDRITGKLKLL